MIKVKISKVGTKINFIEIKGHAGSGPKGHDIVCAGVSSIITGGLNALQNPENFEIKLDEGYALVKAIKEVSAHDAIVLETIETGLKTVEESYNDFIAIKAE